MARLFVVNCTRQHKRIYYRVDFSPEGEAIPDRRYLAPKSQECPAGRQVSLGGDLHVTAINDVIKQLRRYGAQDVKDMSRLPRATVPYLYSIDLMVPAKTIQQLLLHNRGVQIKIGEDRRRTLAIAASTVALDPQDFSVSIEQETEQELTERSGAKVIEEGFAVDKSAGPPPDGRNRRRKNAA